MKIPQRVRAAHPDHGHVKRCNASAIAEKPISDVQFMLKPLREFTPQTCVPSVQPSAFMRTHKTIDCRSFIHAALNESVRYLHCNKFRGPERKTPPSYSNYSPLLPGIARSMVTQKSLRPAAARDGRNQRSDPSPPNLVAALVYVRNLAQNTH